MKKTLSLALVVSLVAGAAFAHAHLTSETPAAKASVVSPSELVLTFSEDVSLRFTGVTVTGPGKVQVGQNAASLSDGDKVLHVQLVGPLPPGAYTVAWHALSKDGHKTHGHYGFTVK